MLSQIWRPPFYLLPYLDIFPHVGNNRHVLSVSLTWHIRTALTWAGTVQPHRLDSYRFMCHQTGHSDSSTASCSMCQMWISTDTTTKHRLTGRPILFFIELSVILMLFGCRLAWTEIHEYNFRNAKATTWPNLCQMQLCAQLLILIDTDKENFCFLKTFPLFSLSNHQL